MQYIIVFIMLVVNINISYAQEKNINHELEIQLLPAKNLYDPPIADPRWPKFLMGLERDFKGGFGKNLWSFSFGENIGLARFKVNEHPYEFGVQAATFGIMDIKSNPTMLVDQDYFIGLGLSHAAGNIQQLYQISHSSAHIGDEFLLSEQGKNLSRINLSYETIRWYGRYKNAQKSISPYVSLGYIFHIEPNHVKRLFTEAGIDFYSKKIIFNNSTRFIIGVDYSAWQENNYKGTLTARAGLQYERTSFCNRFLQLLLQYKQGKSQIGQFYDKNVKSIGILVAFSS